VQEVVIAADARVNNKTMAIDRRFLFMV